MRRQEVHKLLLPICLLLALTARAAGVREIVVPADPSGPEISARLWTLCAVPPGPVTVDSGGATLTIKAVEDCGDIDPRRNKSFGFSRGGYTGLVLAGAGPDFHAAPFPCPAEFFMCKHDTR
jgi:hypothetical protein